MFQNLTCHKISVALNTQIFHDFFPLISTSLALNLLMIFRKYFPKLYQTTSQLIIKGRGQGLLKAGSQGSLSRASNFLSCSGSYRFGRTIICFLVTQPIIQNAVNLPYCTKCCHLSPHLKVLFEQIIHNFGIFSIYYLNNT